MNKAIWQNASRLRKNLAVGGRQLTHWIRRPLGMVGFAMSAGSLLLLGAYLVLALNDLHINRYLEAFVFLIVPGGFVLGLVLIPVSGLLHRRRRKGTHAAAWSDLHLGEPRVVGVVAVVSVLTLFVVLPVLFLTAYHGYTYTESTRFCGNLCHTVMQPQAIAHARSGHARVHCAECHIGSGASWFVKSKLSGMRQVWAVLADRFSRPIPPAITELRPASDTCEHCHWPSRFSGRQYKRLTHFRPNESNDRRDVEILVKVGGSTSPTAGGEGIHMHMLGAGPIEFTALDEGLQDIVEVRYRTSTGELRRYRAQEEDGAANRASREGPPIVRTIDCMDCHNRAAHLFRSPQVAIDEALARGRLSSRIPFIKREAVAALLGSYTDVDAAFQGIEQHLLAFYREQHPAIWTSHEAEIQEAIQVVQEAYRQNSFPTMKEDWRTYPDNIGHHYSPGCFRCHDGRHVDDEGRAISSDCNICHLFIKPLEGQPGEFTFGEFEHPFPLSIHKKLRCDGCHAAGEKPKCSDCHDSYDWEKMRGGGRLIRLPAADEDEAM